MTNKFISFLLSILSFTSLFAQSWSEVKDNPLYYFGEGWGETVEAADQQALNMLVSQISVNVVVESENEVSQSQKDGKIVSDNQNFRYAAKTYTQATLDSSQYVVLSDPSKAHVGRWIKKSDFGKLLVGRRSKIHEMVDAAERAKEKGKVDVALKNYYWAITLLKSMPQSNSETYRDHNLMAWLPEQIDDVLSDVRVTVTKVDGDDVELYFTYKGKPVNSLDFTYSDGGFPSSICSAKDGYGLIELSPGYVHGIYHIDIEYEYRGQSSMDPEIMSVMAVVPEVRMRKASFSVKDDPEARADLALEDSQVLGRATSFTDIEEMFFQLPKQVDDNEAYLETVNQLETAIRTKSYASVRPLLTDNAQGIFNKLIKYGQGKIIGTPHYTFTPFGDRVMVRGLQMSFSFRNGVRKNFTEDLVFTLNPDNKIENISFGLGRTTEADILGQSAYSEEARHILAQFLENYQTAYALGRLDYLQTIFDDDAIIIVGQVLQNATRPNDLGYA
ncbi:MAG: LPP20 family lipoprotein, partial [Bacteroidales bacterium]|nr:LPP20 family lipoprotein [Bacteroidales bacterium]